jgi:excisionase family DNA binding protein
MTKDVWLKPFQVALLLNVSQRTVYRMIAESYFVVAKFRGSLRVSEKSVQSYVQREIYSYAAENGLFCDSECHPSSIDHEERAILPAPRR